MDQVSKTKINRIKEVKKWIKIKKMGRINKMENTTKIEEKGRS